MNYAILSRMNYYLTIDIGGTKTRIACFPQDSKEPVSVYHQHTVWRKTYFRPNI
jgi:sugar (pentulose or hexulose) kinase